MNKAVINTTDTIHATVISGGNTIVTMTMSGYSSLSELMATICHKLAGVAGLVRVELRNSTLGWLEHRMLRLRAGVSGVSSTTTSSMPVQLSLF
ncbi:MAG: hypothetical protein NC082_05935 [Clostridiales bacterium]|nr:hypothetical protein [Clostridiales bacterium]